MTSVCVCMEKIFRCSRIPIHLLLEGLFSYREATGGRGNYMCSNVKQSSVHVTMQEHCHLMQVVDNALSKPVSITGFV